MARADDDRESLEQPRRPSRPRFDRGRGGAGARAASLEAIGPGRTVAAVSGVALLLLMLPDWYGGANGWQLKLVDVVLFGLGAFAIALALGALLGRDLVRPAAAATALTVGGAVAVGIMLTLVLESSGGSVALVLSLAAASGILYGGLLARP